MSWWPHLLILCSRRLEPWTLDTWTRGIWTPGGLDSGQLDAWNLDGWTFRLYLRISKDHAYSTESIGSNVTIFGNSVLTLKEILLSEIESHYKQLSRTVQKKPSKVIQKIPAVESLLWPNYWLTVQSSDYILKWHYQKGFGASKYNRL